MDDGKLFYLTWIKYLKLSHEISKKYPTLKDNLIKSKDFYRPLGNYRKRDFHDIWTEKPHLFEWTRLKVSPETLSTDPYSLDLSIPLRDGKCFLEEIKQVIKEKKKELDLKNYTRPHFSPYSKRNLNPQLEYENFLFFEFVWNNFKKGDPEKNEIPFITNEILINFGKEIRSNSKRRILPYSFFGEDYERDFDLERGHIKDDFLKSKRMIFKRCWTLLGNVTLGLFPKRTP